MNINIAFHTLIDSLIHSGNCGTISRHNLMRNIPYINVVLVMQIYHCPGVEVADIYGRGNLT